MLDIETKTGVDLRIEASPAITGTLASFGAALAGRKVRPRTIETYRKVVTGFVTWLDDEATIADINADSIGRYQVARGHLAAATIAKDLSGIRAYCRWCIKAQTAVGRSDAGIRLAQAHRADPARLEAA